MVGDGLPLQPLVAVWLFRGAVHQVGIGLYSTADAVWHCCGCVLVGVILWFGQAKLPLGVYLQLAR